MMRYLLSTGLLLAGLLPTSLLADCQPLEHPAQRLEALAQATHEDKLLQTPALGLLTGEPITALPALSLETTEAVAARSKQRLKQLRCIDPAALTADERNSWYALQYALEQARDFAPHHRLRFDVTPYSLGLVMSSVLPVALTSTPLDTPEAVHAQLALVSDLARYLDDMRANLLLQMEAGIYMPQSTLPVARGLLAAFEAQLPALLAIAPERVAGLDAAAEQQLQEGLSARLEGEIKPALERLLAVFDERYAARAPTALGLGQYAGGQAYYESLIYSYTNQRLTPREVHELGLRYLADIEQRMGELQRALGHAGDRASFQQAMMENPRFYDRDEDAQLARYRRYIHAMDARLHEQFSLLPRAAYDVQRLEPAAEASITYGYYQPPVSPEGTGYFRFNGCCLDERPALWTAGLIYHELMPGHHLQVALNQQNEALSRFRRGIIESAFAEGWANYAAHLALEMGLLDDPYDEYGLLLLEAMSSARLVVDTGLNAMGWSSEQAAQFMREHTVSSETEIATELQRYGMALPGQALAYKLGKEYVLALRNRSREAAGEDWDPRVFHAQLLSVGMLPLPVLQRHMESLYPAP